jgi:predicted nucleic acid-binding protein
MKLYLDVSCLNRPFDDQDQARIRVETAAITLIFERIDSSVWSQVASEMSLIEINAIPNVVRRSRVRMLLPDSDAIMKLNDATFARAEKIGQFGFKPADAIHLVAAEQTKADVLLSCDDRLCSLAIRCQSDLEVTVANPVDWLKVIENDNA